MYYEASLHIPKNTLPTAPVSVTIPVHPGRVNHVEVFFPPGSAGLANVIITMWGRQVWPTNPDSSFRGDGTPISFDEDLQLIDPPFEFEVVGWNDDDTFYHEPTIRISVLPEDDTLKQLFARLGLGPTGPAEAQG